MKIFSFFESPLMAKAEAPYNLLTDHDPFSRRPGAMVSTWEIYGTTYVLAGKYNVRVIMDPAMPEGQFALIPS